MLDGQEAAHLKRFYLDDLRRALEIGFGRLSVRERTLLRLHFIDGLNIERIGAVHGDFAVIALNFREVAVGWRWASARAARLYCARSRRPERTHG